MRPITWALIAIAAAGWAAVWRAARRSRGGGGDVSHALTPGSYVYVDDDGSARELTADEREYLSTEFLPGDGARPYVKAYYKARTPDGRLSGFLARRELPPHVAVRPHDAPGD